MAVASVGGAAGSVAVSVGTLAVGGVFAGAGEVVTGRGCAGVVVGGKSGSSGAGGFARQRLGVVVCARHASHARTVIANVPSARSAFWVK